MSERFQAQSRAVKRATILLLVLAITSFAAGLVIDQGWVRDRNVVAILGWVPFVLKIAAVGLLLFIIRGWETTRYGTRLKVPFSIYLVFTLAGGFAYRSGLVDWLNAQGKAVEHIVYATTSLAPLAIVLWLMVLVIKDQEERTKREVEAKLHGHAEEAGQTTPPSGTIGHLTH